MSEVHGDTAFSDTSPWGGGRAALAGDVLDRFSRALAAPKQTAKPKRTAGEAPGSSLGVTALGVGGLMFLVAVTYMEVSYVQSLTRAASAEGVACGWWWSVSVILLLEALYRPLAVKLNGAPAPLISLGNTALRGYLVAVFSVLSTIEMVQQGHRAQLGFLIGMGALGACYLVFKLSVEAIRGARRPLVSEPAEPEQLSLPFV